MIFLGEIVTDKCHVCGSIVLFLCKMTYFILNLYFCAYL